MSSKLDKNKIFSGMATEHTLKEVVTAVKSISINVGDIVMGDVTVESSDTTTHGKLDITNTAIGLSNSKLEDVKTKLDTINTSVNGKTLDKLTSSIDVSGQYLNVPLISGFTLNTTTLSTNDTLNRILNKEGDIQGKIYYTEGASVWADSAPVPTVNVLNPKGWLYTNTNAGNAMNLFYFNGTNETRILSEISGMYAVVENLSTKLNDSMIFGIYTKSATSFFTSRITHSPASGVDMVAGGKYLLYWGDVDEYIYPNLPRLNFTDVVTTGTANPSEEILSVTLNTNSSTAAGDIKISIETLGVVFDLEAREYNLLGSPTEYQTLVNIKNKITDIEYKTNLLAFSNTTGINELMTYDRASETKLDTINTTITNKTLSKTTSSIDISGQTLNVNTISGYATSALQTTGNDKLDTLNTTITNKTLDKLTSSIDISGQTLNVNTISGFSTSALQTTGNDKLDTLNTTITNKTLDKLTSSIDISGQTLNVNTISGYATSALQTTGNDKLDTLNTTITNKTLDKLTSSIDISGQTLNVNTISGYATSALQTTGNDKLDTLNTTITNKTLSKTTSSIDISGQTLNVNTISGYATSALQTAGNTSLSDIKTNSDKLKYVGDDLKTVISNTGFDAKIRDKDGNAITSTAVGIDGIRGLDVVLKNGTPAAPISVLIDPTNVLTCAVNNFPASYPIDAGGALSSAVGALNVNLRDTQGNTVGISGAPLVVSSNLITGFALETGGNLASIKSNSDKFKFEGDFLKTQVNNGLTNPFIVTTTNPSTNYANETGGNLAAIKVNSDKNTYDPSGNLKVNLVSGSISIGSINIKDTSGNNIYADPSGNLKTNIQNSSLDTHCYGSSNGTNWHHLSTDANGQLNVHSKLQDGAGTDLTSTLNGAKQSLDVNVSNTVPVSGTFYPATQPVSGSVNIGTGATTAGLSIIANDVPASERGLITASCLYARAPALSGVPSTPITAIINGSRAYLETRDEDAVAKLTSIDTGVGTTNTRLTTTNTTLSAISNKMVTQSNAGATVGLNVYNIYPNKLIYRMAGSASATVTGQFLGPEALAFDGTTFNIGLNYPSNFNIYLTAAGTRSVDLDYIDANGNRILSTITINNTDQVRLSNAVNINNMNWTPTSGNVDTKLRAIARTGVYRNQLSTFLSGAGVITVPNGYIGVVSNLYYYTAVGDDVYMIVKDKYNNHKTSRFMAQPISAAGKYTNVGDINEPLIAGDSVYFLSGQSGSGQKYLHAIVTMEPL